MEDIETMLGEARRRLNDESQQTKAGIIATKSAVDQLNRQPCLAEEIAEKLTHHLEEIASRGAARILQLKDHGDLSQTNIESHFSGAVMEVVVFLLAKEIDALVVERLREVWPQGISAQDRTAQLKRLQERLATLRETNDQIDRQRLAAGVKPRVFVR